MGQLKGKNELLPAREPFRAKQSPRRNKQLNKQGQKGISDRDFQPSFAPSLW